LLPSIDDSLSIFNLLLIIKKKSFKKVYWFETTIFSH
jgi:hypothetical protein